MARILNMPNPQDHRRTAGLRVQIKPVLKPATIDDVAALILAIEQKGTWHIANYNERVEWYMKLTGTPMEHLCDAATVMLLKRLPVSADGLLDIVRTMDEKKTDQTTQVPTQPEPALEVPSDTVPQVLRALTRIANTLEAIEFHLADRKTV